MSDTVDIVFVEKDVWVAIATNPVGLRIKSNGIGRWHFAATTDGAAPSLELDGEIFEGVSHRYIPSFIGTVYVRVDTDGHKFSITPDIGKTPVSLGSGGLTEDAWGTPKVTQDFSLFHGMFTFDVPPSMWLIEEGSVEVPNSTSTRATSILGHLNVTSGGTALDTCHVESRRHPRYQPDRGLKYAASIGFKGANSDGILRAGLIVDGENGVYFKTIGDGKLYACILNDGVETHAEEITLPFAIDITLGNIYDIRMQWRGVGKVDYFAGNPDTSLLEKVHTIEFLNTLDEKTSIRNPAMSVAFHAENVTEEVSLWCGCVDVTSEGGAVVREQYGEHSHNNTSIGAGGAVFAVRNPQLAPNGKINTRDLRLVRITITADKKSVFKAYQTRDPSAIVGGAWVPTKTGSFVEANHAATSVDTSKMEKFSTFRLAAGQTIERSNPSSETIDFFGVHGDYLVVVCDVGVGVDVELAIEWGEEI